MQIQLHKDGIKASLFILIYMISLNTPYAFSLIETTKGMFIGVRIICTGIMFLICLSHRMKWNRFDVATILFCMCFFSSAIHAGISSKIVTASIMVYLYNALSKVIFVLGQLLAVKIIFSMQEKTCRTVFGMIYWYYTALCLINLVTQILGMEIKTRNGSTFFLGMDNEVGKYYLYAVFYCCVFMILEGKKVSWKLLFVTALTIIEGIYREIGGLTVIGALLAVLVIFLCFASSMKAWNVRQDALLLAMIGIYVAVWFSFTELNILQDFINTYLYGKVNTLRIRFELQSTFVLQWLKSPLWGWGSSLIRDEQGSLKWFDYALRDGHTHNFFIDSLYNYGIFSLVFYLFLLVLTLGKIKGHGTIVSFMGMVMLLIILRGMFENGCQNIFSVLPAAYYLVEWCNKGIMAADKGQINNV